MDCNETLLKILFSGNEFDELPDRLAELNLTTNDAGQYLQQLSSLGLKKLGNELSRINEEKTSIINQTQELAFQEYPTFIETAQCTQDIFQNFQKVNQSTEKLTASLTTLKEKCSEFSQTAQSLSAARRLTSLALSRHTQLLEILELPQLMDTCVRNGYWEEALDLASYVARLERKLSYIPLIVKVAQDVQSCTRLMLSQLIAQLRQPAQLPHCLKIIGYLKRMDVFTQEEIRLKFLQARDAWFRTTLDEIPKEDAYQHVLKTVELSRVHLFDIATQYRAIFTDEDPLVLANQDPNTNESAIYYSWIVQKITDFLAALQSDLPRVSPSSLESVFGQCMYFGLSFGRIGSDFRSLLVPLFSQVVFDRFELSVNKSESQFAEAMASFSPARTAIGSNVASSLMHTAQSSADQVQPPYALIRFTPLAELCNGLIAAFNELRMCAPVQLVVPVTRKLESTLCNCSQIMADFHRHEKEAFTPNEELEFANCLQLYRLDFMTYIQKTLLLMFPPALISAQTGFSTGEITKQELCHLNKESILQPIAHLFKNEKPILIHSTAEVIEQIPSVQLTDSQVDNSKPVEVVAGSNSSVPVEQTETSNADSEVAAQVDASEAIPAEIDDTETVAAEIDVTNTVAAEADAPVEAQISLPDETPEVPLDPIPADSAENPANNELADVISTPEVVLDVKGESLNEVEPANDSLVEGNVKMNIQLQNDTDNTDDQLQPEPETLPNQSDTSESLPSDLSAPQETIDPVDSTKEQEKELHIN
uniref:Conserved oligomeric Golgi complex subunit 8 n=1 Tax=Scapholeberis mucronata TaxID=202097 RepID=A0A4Y7NMV4_9CRUS|nr:EOG090X04G7 [Scapholeberis mucronata]